MYSTKSSKILQACETDARSSIFLIKTIVLWDDLILDNKKFAWGTKYLEGMCGGNTGDEFSLPDLIDPCKWVLKYFGVVLFF